MRTKIHPVISIALRLLTVLGLIGINVSALFLAPFVSTIPAAPAAGSCAAPANTIMAENCLTGSPASQWDVMNGGDSSIQGFATDISVNRGQTVNFKIDTLSTNYRLDIYRMGYYGGNGARQVTSLSPSVTLPQTQPACLNDPATGLNDCGNWAVSASWTVPITSTAGIYFARLTRLDTTGANHIFFIVRDDSSHSDLLFQTSDTTWQAYNEYGGNSLYAGGPGTNPGRAYKVSYNRPFTTRQTGWQDFFFNSEYPMVRWLESNGYDVSYISGIDTDRFGSLLLNHKVFMSVGHDEYWSGQQRTNVEAARSAGVNLAFFSGNEVYWKTRYENSIDGSNTPYRTLVTYKETDNSAVLDPADPPIWTGTWRDPRFSPPADGDRPENALTGQIFTVNCCSYDIQVSAKYSPLRFWRNTRVATLAPDTFTTLTGQSLGYEWDETLDNGSRPAGEILMSETAISVPQYLLDYGHTTGPGMATHHLSLYRASSGALVFGAGTIQWTWGLDGNHDQGASTPDPAMQQATVNLFADMGVQPATLQTGLVAAMASTDTSAPASQITLPVLGQTLPVSVPVTIQGTAGDTDGVVAGVEVSTDGGTTWHPASGLTNWRYTWTPTITGTINLRSRAIDDSVNLELPEPGITVNLANNPAPTCPCTIWDNSTTPQHPAVTDGKAIEIGVKFRTNLDGYITGVRFYKGTANTGSHIGRLYTSGGAQLSAATFTNETASGWQQVSFAAPVAVISKTTYVASYYSPGGYFAEDYHYFTQGYYQPALHALADGVDGGNGVYVYGTGFPTSSYKSANFYVDVIFTPNRGFMLYLPIILH